MQHTKHHNTVESVPVLQAASAVLTVILLARQCRPVQASAAGVGRAVENSPVTRATILQPACCTLDTEDSIDTRYLTYTVPCLVWAFTTGKTSSVVSRNM